ncbi:MAG: gamma-glutamyl-gamma-aminobutyrate hydrolase family protein [Clostridia bacterium]|nr:gamma-glutamyl-gamma-aminobutyrate hydrolase family protein [Clostridia bacterium]
MAPLIGITTSSNNDGDFFLRRQYCSAVLRAGGIPIMLPPVSRPHAALGIIDAVILSGGGDIAPRLCGITDYDPMLLFEVSPERDEYELTLAELTYERNIPTLGICRGMQVMNCALGGSLHFHIDAHRQTLSREQPSHTVTLPSGTLLRGLIGEAELAVNSFHHQAVNIPSNALRVSARAEDGIIEALEAPDKAFYLGVQWHPEHMEGFAAEILFAALCAAAVRR